MQVTNPEDKNYNALFVGVRPGDTIVSYGPFVAMKWLFPRRGRLIQRDFLNAVGQMVTGTKVPRAWWYYPYWAMGGYG